VIVGLQGRKTDAGDVAENRERVLDEVGVLANGICFAESNLVQTRSKDLRRKLEAYKEASISRSGVL